MVSGPRPREPEPWSRSGGEAVVTGLAGAVLSGATLTPVGLGAIGAAVGGANGAISGWRRIYDWRRPSGVGGFILDSTWGLPGTAIGMLLHGVQRGLASSEYRDDLSRGQGYHVYGGGVRLKKGFAVTWGNVISNAGDDRRLDPETATGRRRRRFIRTHEGLHVWQSRAFGPLYPLLYASWTILGGAVGLVTGLFRRRDLWRTIETVAYYDNPFEVWAYRRDGNWPPSRALDELTWGGSSGAAR